MKTVADIIDSFKRRDKEALVYKTGFRTFRSTYKQLHKKIFQTIVLLEQLKLKKGDRIILWGLNSPDWVSVFLACAYRGIVIVPIDATAQPEFVQKLQENVHAKVIFHSQYKLPPDLGIKKYILEYLDTYHDSVQKTEEIKPSVTENDLLEIVYTSGTTADPKGVMLTHKNLIADMLAVCEAVKPTPDMTFLSVLPLSHLFEQNPGFLTPLFIGCTIVYMRGLRPNLIFKTLAEEKITNIILVPRLLKLFADGIKREIEAKNLTGIFTLLLKMKVSREVKKLLFHSVHKKFGTSFSYFVAGGAPLDQDLEGFWRQLGFTVLQGYGLTECSPVLTVNKFEKYKQGSVGTALCGIELKTNADGEIYAKGDNITQGYFQKEKETKTLFDGSWMRTGDLGIVDDEGFLFLKGRQKDLIVSSGGMNVYPEDIEKVLLKQPEVKDVCVLGLPTNEGEEVHAEIILKKKADLRTIVENVNKELNDSQQIISYALWSKEDFPRTTTLKIQKRFVLTEIQNRKKQTTPEEKNGIPKLYSIIARINDIDPQIIKPLARLNLDLKLTSINRVELVSLIEQEFNVDIDEEEITKETTVEELEKMIKERKRIQGKNIFHPWLLSMPMRIVRYIYNAILIDNLIRLFCRRTVIGKKNLGKIHQPVIFISNHVGYFDTPNILMSLPFDIRNKIASAAYREYFDVPKNQIFKRLLYGFYYYHASLFTNIYLFPKEKGFKKSLEYTGELLDKKWNILFFPEGEHSPSGKLQPFRNGIGWIVKEMRVPVVPIKHSGLEKIMAGDQHQIPRFGKMTITFGNPVTPDFSKSIPEITQELQTLIEKM
jgi:long-chain acyl-CoA synthetase